MILAKKVARIAGVKADDDNPTPDQDPEDRRLKRPRSPVEIEEMATRIRDVADQLQWFATAMRAGEGPKVFEFVKKTPMNKFIPGLELWLEGVKAEWHRQIITQGKSKRVSDKLDQRDKDGRDATTEE